MVQRSFKLCCDIQGQSDWRNRKQCMLDTCELVHSKTKSAYNIAVQFYSRIFAQQLVILIDPNILLISCVCPGTTPSLLFRAKTHAIVNSNCRRYARSLWHRILAALSSTYMTACCQYKRRDTNVNIRTRVTRLEQTFKLRYPLSSALQYSSQEKKKI